MTFLSPPGIKGLTYDTDIDCPYWLFIKVTDWFSNLIERFWLIFVVVVVVVVVVFLLLYLFFIRIVWKYAIWYWSRVCVISRVFSVLVVFSIYASNYFTAELMRIWSRLKAGFQHAGFSPLRYNFLPLSVRITSWIVKKVSPYWKNCPQKTDELQGTFLVRVLRSFINLWFCTNLKLKKLLNKAKYDSG